MQQQRKEVGIVARTVLRVRPALLGQKFLMELAPRPMIDPEHKVILIWSPKCACTTSIIWFFKLSGLYDEALAYDSWPHRYRQKVYYHSEKCRQGLTDNLRGYRIVRVMRDPYQRAVSSYRHALMTGYLDQPMSAYLGRQIDGQRNYSFIDFLACIGLKDMSPLQSNTHHAVQTQAFERVFPAHDVINVSKQDLLVQLSRIENEIGVAPTNFPALGWLKLTQKGGRHSKSEPYNRDVSRDAFSRSTAAKGPWPAYSDFLTDEARAHIRRLYADDFKNFAAYL